MPEIFGDVRSQAQTHYSNNVQFALSRLPAPIEQSFSPIANMKGKEMQAVELIGRSKARRNAPANAPTPNIPPSHAGIFVSPQRVDWGRTIPKEIEIMNAVDHKSTYVQEGAMAVREGIEDICLEAIYGPRYVKNLEDGAPTAVVYDTANRIAADYEVAATNTNLTVRKLTAGIRKLIQNGVNVDYEDLYLLLTGIQNEALYKQVEITSQDFRSKNKIQIEEKRVTGILGITFISCEALPFLSANLRRCPLYCKSGMHAGPAMPMTTEIEKSVAMQYQWHPYIEAWHAATRSEDGKVIDIICDETK